MLADEGTTLVKVFLDVSREEQRVRLQERIDDPEKQWKFRRDDLKVRARFDEYLAAGDEAITETSTGWAPWHVVPADRNWVKALATAALLVEALERIDPQLPAAEPGIEGLVVPP
jgi:polyphosphate kinase 2 (PPK2 family)